MKATLEGQEINVRICSNKLGKKTITWPESLADDYMLITICAQLPNAFGDSQNAVFLQFLEIFSHFYQFLAIMNVFSIKTFTVLTHIASPNAFGNCAHIMINIYTSTNRQRI